MGERRPGWLNGLWRREGRAFGPDPLEEVSDVVWLQVGGYFADLRLPRDGTAKKISRLDQAQAFTGSVSWDGLTVTWRHDIDTLGRPAGYQETAVVEPNGSTLLGRGPGYLERWRRETDVGPTAVIERRTASGSVSARVVSVAHMTVSVWGGTEPGGATLCFEAGGWDIEARVGAGSIPWAAVSAARTGRISTGWRKVAP